MSQSGPCLLGTLSRKYSHLNIDLSFILYYIVWCLAIGLTWFIESKSTPSFKFFRHLFLWITLFHVCKRVVFGRNWDESRLTFHVSTHSGSCLGSSGQAQRSACHIALSTKTLYPFFVRGNPLTCERGEHKVVFMCAWCPNVHVHTSWVTWLALEFLRNKN